MYFVVIVALLFVIPALSLGGSLWLSSGQAPPIWTAGCWYTFWAVGGRLLLAGVRQTIQPSFTAKEIFEIEDQKALAIVRELGFANLCMGILGLAGFFRGDWVLPGALVGGLYYGFAAFGHLRRAGRNAKENFALFTDLFAFAALIGFFSASIHRH